MGGEAKDGASMMKRACIAGLLLGVLCLGNLLHSADGKQASAEGTREIRFEKEIWLKITPPCSLESEGSKLTVYPQNVDFKSFVRAVDWEHGVPGYLRETAGDAKGFDFDLTDRVDFKEKMIVRIARTTMRVTTEGMIRVGKDGVMPEVLKDRRK
jgi:hypothetical protein